jgi:hypothetical protein
VMVGRVAIAAPRARQRFGIGPNAFRFPTNGSGTLSEATRIRDPVLTARGSPG